MVRFCAALVAAAAVGFAAPADDKKDDEKDLPVKGTWVKSDAESVTLDFKSKEKLVVTVQVGDAKIIATCKYTLDKEGKLKGTVTEVGGDAPDKPPAGLEFKFTIKVDKDTAKVSDFEADGGDGAKAIMEGDYKMEK